MSKRIFVVLTALAMAGCDLASAPNRPSQPPETQQGGARRPAGDFVHSQSEDLSGYYRPSGMIGADDFELTQVFVGQAPDFEAWEKGERHAGFAPVMMEVSALGGRTLRVLPDRYLVSDDRVSMSGTVDGVGEMSLDARLDKGALSTARRNLGSEEGPAMTGTVRIGGQTISGVKFSWYGGD